MDAPVLYMVKVWVSPDGGERYLRWLETTHMAEVIREPGFLWAQKCHLEQTDEQGWESYLLIYGLDSHAALDAYLHSPAHDRFSYDLESFDAVHRAERFYGTVDLQLEKTTPSPKPTHASLPARSALTEAVPSSPTELDSNLEAYSQHRAQLEAEHRGEYVAVAGGRIVGVYPSADKAERAVAQYPYKLVFEIGAQPKLAPLFIGWGNSWHPDGQ
jgi:hypothetical protein